MDAQLLHSYRARSVPVFAPFQVPRVQVSGARQLSYRANINVLRNMNLCGGCFEFYLRKIFATAPKIGKNYFIFAILFLQHSVLWSCLGHTESKVFVFLRIFLRLASLSSGVMFHSFWCHCKGPGIGGTLGLQFIPTQAYKRGSVGLWYCSPPAASTCSRFAACSGPRPPSVASTSLPALTDFALNH